MQVLNEWFDAFAEAVARQAARAWFFAACFLLVLVWAPSLPLFGKVDTWQLVINTATTIITFLMVALLQNTQDRSTKALTHKLDAVLGALVVLLRNESADHPEVQRCIAELEEMAGVEMESST